MTDQMTDLLKALAKSFEEPATKATSPQDQLIEAAHDLFRSEYSKHARTGMDEAEHDDCIRTALEAVIALVLDWQRECIAELTRDVQAVMAALSD